MPSQGKPRPSGGRRARLVTLTTDLGASYAAQMKGVLYSRLAPGQVVDLAHDLPRHALREGAFLLAAMARRFPRGTVHVAVLDPGVGGERAPIAIRTREGSYLVGPDNGVLSYLGDELGLRACVRLDPRRVVPGRTPSATFEGRDLFAPAAARLAAGTPLGRLGPPHRPLRLPPPRADRSPGLVTGEILHVDHFGNLITSIPSDWIPLGDPAVRVALGRGRAPRPFPRVRTYEDLARGSPGLLGSSFGTIELAVREGSAARRFHLRTGDTLRFRPGRSERRR